MTGPDHDVVVIGAGPAGSAAAIGLAERGWRVLLVDKARFPRDKVCGDFLSPRSLAVLDALGCADELRRAQPWTIRESTVHLNGELLSRGPMPQVGTLPGYGMVIPRAVLDEIVFRRAAAAGATVLEGFAATELVVRDGGVQVHGRARTGPGTLGAQLAVVADGARSRLAAGLGVTPVGQRDLFALRAYFRDVRCAPDTTATFFDADFFPGYAWLFPTGDGGANVGMGMGMRVARRYRINLRERFLEWLDHDPGLRDLLGGASRCGRVVGWPLTGYLGDHGNYAERVLVVGDAGRFVDPLNGEGVHTALESARLASAVADEALAGGDCSAAALSGYERRWRAAFDLDLRTSDLFVTMAQNRALRPLWLLIVRMAAQRSMVDPEFAALSGGIMAGVVPAHQGLSFEHLVQTLLQRPEFWLQHRRELRQALAALWLPGGRQDEETDQVDTLAWLGELSTRSVAVADRLTATYGVPWVPAARPAPRPASPAAGYPLPTIVMGPEPGSGEATMTAHRDRPAPMLRSLLAGVVAGNLRLAARLNALAWEQLTALQHPDASTGRQTAEPAPAPIRLEIASGRSATVTFVVENRYGHPVEVSFAADPLVAAGAPPAPTDAISFDPQAVTLESGGHLLIRATLRATGHVAVGTVYTTSLRVRELPAPPLPIHVAVTP